MIFVALAILSLIKFNVYAKPAITDNPVKAVAALEGATYDLKSNTTFFISGVVKFTQYEYDGPVDVNISISGLPLGYGGMNHGFHVHTLGINNTSNNFTIRCGSTGGHFNPYTNVHGDITFLVRHVGDLGNVEVSNDGTISVQLTDYVVQLDGPNSIIGRSIVLHQLEDDKGLNPDEGSKTTGNAGARIACGVVGYDS